MLRSVFIHSNNLHAPWISPVLQLPVTLRDRYSVCTWSSSTVMRLFVNPRVQATKLLSWLTWPIIKRDLEIKICLSCYHSPNPLSPLLSDFSWGGLIWEAAGTACYGKRIWCKALWQTLEKLFLIPSSRGNLLGSIKTQGKTQAII